MAYIPHMFLRNSKLELSDEKLRRLELEASHLNPFKAEAENEWGFTSTSLHLKARYLQNGSFVSFIIFVLINSGL